MRKLLVPSVAVLTLLFACTSRAQTTFTGSWSGSQRAGRPTTHRIGFGAVNAVTQIIPKACDPSDTTCVPTNGLVSATLPQGCNTPFLYGYDPNSLSGPALAVGEWAQDTVTFYRAASSTSQITAVGLANPEGYPAFSVAATGCTSVDFGGGSIGNAIAGPGFGPALYYPNLICDSAQSAISFSLQQADGTYTQEASDAGSVTCTVIADPATRQQTFIGHFSGTLTTLQHYEGSFTIAATVSTGSGRDPISLITAKSATWSITY